MSENDIKYFDNNLMYYFDNYNQIIKFKQLKFKQRMSIIVLLNMDNLD